MKTSLAVMAFAVAASVACSASRSAPSPPPEGNNTSANRSSSAPVAATPQTTAPCSLNKTHAPVVLGLQLGMTREQILGLFPGSKNDPDVQRFLTRAPDPLGEGELMLRPSKYLSADTVGRIKHVIFGLLDDRVYSLNIAYDGPGWPHVDRFVEKFVAGSNLPAADQWQPYAGFDDQMKTLSCADFSIRVFAGGSGGNLNYVLLEDREAQKELEERRKKAEKVSSTPGQS